MKTTELTISTKLHNLKKAFYSLQVLTITLAIPALFYIGISHDVQSSAQKTDSRIEKPILAETASYLKSKVSL